MGSSSGLQRTMLKNKSMLKSSNEASTLYGTQYGPGSSTNIILNLGMDIEGVQSSRASLGGPLRKHLANTQAKIAGNFRNYQNQTQMTADHAANSFMVQPTTSHSVKKLQKHISHAV